MAECAFAPWNDPDEKPLIRFKNVTKTFGDFTAIDKLTLDIYAREFFALLGPSGCGKTTMMRMLAGFETVTTGVIELDGMDIAAVPANKRPVNMMFQSYALFPHLSLWDNIAFGLRRESRDKAAISARVEEMLKLTRLEKFARRKPHQISGGQRQRVALARSLAKAPKLLLLDEPLGALDAKLREATQFELMDIQEKTGTTFVIVTHDQEEAMTVASRVAVMDEGRVMQVATPSDIYEAPSSAYVADFIGDVTIIDGVARASSAKASSAPSDSAHQTRKPQPNELGEWLHDKILSPVLGEREKSPEPAVEAPDLAHDGIAIDWADGQRPLIVTDGNPTLDGLPVKLALRPEKLSISRDKPQAVNAFEGRVIDIAYLGNLSTYHVELAGGQMIKAQVANTRRIARRDITWDDTVWVSWAGTAGVVLTE